jgi:hypothetical protein
MKKHIDLLRSRQEIRGVGLSPYKKVDLMFWAISSSSGFINNVSESVSVSIYRSGGDVGTRDTAVLNVGLTIPVKILITVFWYF